jgi:heme-degrading monooxygenase HmoA
MVEVAFTYDFHTGMDERGYARVAKNATRLMKSAEGFIEFRAQRNMLGSPHVRRTSVWESFSHYAALAETAEFQKLTAEFRTYVTHLDVQVWGPSPLVPQPVKP